MAGKVSQRTLTTIFNQKQFSVVPKSSALLIHIRAPSSSLELTRLYHNIPSQPLISVAIQYILAQFAWTIFAHSINFIQQGLKRTLCIHVSNREISTKDFSEEQYRQLFTPGSKSQSQSPQKRQRDTFVEPPGDRDKDRKYTRGRKRRRSFYSQSLDQSFNKKL